MKRFPTIAISICVSALLCLFALAAGCAPERKPVPASSTEKVSFSVSDTMTSSSSASQGSGSSTTASNTASDGDKRDTSTSTSSASSASSPSASRAPVVNEAANEAAAISGASGMQVGVAIVDLASGARGGYLADEPMVSASMIKLAIAYAFLEQVAAGNYSLDGYYTLQPSDIVGGTGTLSGYGAGAQVTYGEILNKMISVSDNTGANVLIDAVGMDAVNATARKLELSATQLNRYMMDTDAIAAGVENYTSANDVAALLEMAYNGSFVSPEYSSVVVEALEQQQDYGGIMAGLPADVTFAHKTGTLSTVRHDGGIVECERPFVLVTLCGGPGFYEQGALNAMAQIAGTTYSALVAE